jgi:hypothetical protein
MWGMRRGAFVILAGASLAAAAACGTFGSDPEGSPGDTDGAVVPPNADGPASDGEAPDATAQDGGADAVVHSSPCTGDAAAHWLCDDFDRNDLALAGTWQPPFVGGGGNLSVARVAGAPSQPQVLTATVGSQQTAQVKAERLGTETRMHCELDMNVESRGASTAILFIAELNNTAANYYYRVELRGAPDSLLEYGSFDGSTPPTISTNVIVPSGWFHVVLDAKVAATQEVTVTFDGTKVSGSPLDGGSLVAPADQSLIVGTITFAGSGTWVVHYDNVFCDALP